MLKLGVTKNDSFSFPKAPLLQILNFLKDITSKINFTHCSRRMQRTLHPKIAKFEIIN